MSTYESAMNRSKFNISAALKADIEMSVKTYNDV
jgi:hypothetical protein